MDCNLIKSIAGDEWKIEYYDTVTSTNTLLAERTDAPPKTVIIAGSQTQGRGRLGRKFESPKNSGLYMSVLLHPQTSDSRITLAVGLAVAWALEELCELKIMLKWPNDIICIDRKIGGILTESRLGSTVRTTIGIGINLTQRLEDFPQEIWNKAGSAAMCGGKIPQIEQLAGNILTNLEKCIELLERIPQEIIEGCRERLYGMGRDISFAGDKHGKVCGLGDDGCLLVQTENGIESLGSGEVQIKGLY